MFKIISNHLFLYHTSQRAPLKDYTVGFIYRSVQLMILAYIIGYELILNKGYQCVEDISSVLSTKVKGVGYLPVNSQLNSSQLENLNYLKDLFEIKPNIQYKTFDTFDYGIPLSEYNNLFIMTRFIETQQTMSTCDEDISNSFAHCRDSSDCQNIQISLNSWSGKPSGKCVRSSLDFNHDLNWVCEIAGWCPTEKDKFRKEDRIVRNVLNFTIFIKNEVAFKALNKKERNILSNYTNEYLSTCLYDQLGDKNCPIFKLDYVLAKAEPNETERYLMLLHGGVLVIEVNWDCDYDFASTCMPTYSFRRYDIHFKEISASSGNNFRFTHKYKRNGNGYRSLYKAFGLRIVISVTGAAGRFNIVPLMLTAGAGFGLMSLSVLIADFFMANFSPNKYLFRQVKNAYSDRPDTPSPTLIARI